MYLKIFLPKNRIFLIILSTKSHKIWLSLRSWTNSIKIFVVNLRICDSLLVNLIHTFYCSYCFPISIKTPFNADLFVLPLSISSFNQCALLCINIFPLNQINQYHTGLKCVSVTPLLKLKANCTKLFLLKFTTFTIKLEERL